MPGLKGLERPSTTYSNYLLIHYELGRWGGKSILVLVCVCFSADYDRGPATARPVSPSQELWLVLGGVLRDSIRLLRERKTYVCSNSLSAAIMNAKEIRQCAARLSESNCAYVIINNGERGIIVPPGADRTLICLRLVDAEGHPIGPVKKIPATELRLEELPAPPPPLRLAPWCVNCGSPVMMKCSACGSSI